MSVLSVLIIIFILLTVLITGKSSIYILSGLFANLLLFMLFLLLLHLGAGVYLATLSYILFNSLITLVYVNGWNEKTKMSLYSILFFLLLLWLMFIPLIQQISVHGFTDSELEELSSMDLHIPISFSELSISVLLIGISGALIDGSMSIASGTFELYRRRENELGFKELLNSSLTVVRSILNSTVNTLLFAFISSAFILIFWYQDLSIPWYEMINSKAFVSELTIIILSGVSVSFILPFTSLVTCWYLVNYSNLSKSNDF